MSMNTKLVLNAPLKTQAGAALNQCINKINNWQTPAPRLNELAAKVKDVVPFGLDPEVAVMILRNNEDNLFYNHSQVHFSKYSQNTTTFNETLLLTVNIYIRNYSDEIDQFLTALAPQVISNYTGVKRQFLGTVQREDEAVPALIFHDATTNQMIIKTPRL